MQVFFQNLSPGDEKIGLGVIQTQIATFLLGNLFQLVQFLVVVDVGDVLRVQKVANIFHHEWRVDVRVGDEECCRFALQARAEHGFFDGVFPQRGVGLVSVESSREVLAAEDERGEAGADRLPGATRAYQEYVPLGKIEHS